MKFQSVREEKVQLLEDLKGNDKKAKESTRRKRKFTGQVQGHLMIIMLNLIKK